MKRLRLIAAIFLMPAWGIFMLGCGSSDESSRDMPPSPKVTKRSSGTKGTEPKETPGGGGGGGGLAAAGATELESTGSGTIKGTVAYDGNPPSQTTVKMEKDPDYCRRTDPKKLQVWDVGPNKGVANVVVWLRAPKGKCFKIRDDMKQWKGEPVKINQPHCAFEPRVVVLFPSYYDPKAKKQTPTGQKFDVLNDATIPHNTNWTPSSTLLNQSGNQILPAKSKEPSKLDIPFKPSRPTEAGGEQTVTFACNIHTWMKGYAKIFDHPFAAVTKEDGTYEIKNAPAEVELDLVYWHESMNTWQVLEKVTLKDRGTTTKDFKIKEPERQTMAEPPGHPPSPPPKWPGGHLNSPQVQLLPRVAPARPPGQRGLRVARRGRVENPVDSGGCSQPMTPIWPPGYPFLVATLRPSFSLLGSSSWLERSRRRADAPGWAWI